MDSLELLHDTATPSPNIPDQALERRVRFDLPDFANIHARPLPAYAKYSYFKSKSLGTDSPRESGSRVFWSDGRRARRSDKSSESATFGGGRWTLPTLAPELANRRFKNPTVRLEMWTVHSVVSLAIQLVRQPFHAYVNSDCDDRISGCHENVAPNRGKTLKNCEQKVNTEEKLTLVLHRNCLILLGKHPLR
jgi:hypothetical protein